MHCSWPKSYTRNLPSNLYTAGCHGNSSAVLTCAAWKLGVSNAPTVFVREVLLLQKSRRTRCARLTAQRKEPAIIPLPPSLNSGYYLGSFPHSSSRVGYEFYPLRCLKKLTVPSREEQRYSCHLGYYNVDRIQRRTTLLSHPPFLVASGHFELKVAHSQISYLALSVKAPLHKRPLCVPPFFALLIVLRVVRSTVVHNCPPLFLWPLVRPSLQ